MQMGQQRNQCQKRTLLHGQPILPMEDGQRQAEGFIPI
ncbi:hypothetical protein BOO71_0003442 [Deinococcus marmoris]|uniref:Uncharacterized protein n=1 Tax=Deinococcus marmoris TaxID=249408 RepID=A0A1U7P221_9DEIO|nr:hypothetical protein BOO71_0003442 [Deinococcus marmoris]